MVKNGSVTMKDIARELGVSVATVSRALKDSPRISAEKRDEIKRYARERNFTPNIIAEALRKSKVQSLKVIGVIVPQFTHFYFSSILAGIEEEASARGYQLMVAQSDERYEREVEICKSFYENKVCGVIVSQAKDTAKYDHFQFLIDQNVPLVFYDRMSTGVNASRVVIDDYMGALSAVNHLINTGCRRIAYYGLSLNLEIGKNRYNGYRDTLLKHGIQPDEQLIRMCDNRSDAESITPDLILYSCKRMGLRVPEDVSICGFTNCERAVACDPMLTTVEQRGVRVGEEAANILINKVEGVLPIDSIEKRVVRTRLIVRGTTR